MKEKERIQSQILKLEEKYKDSGQDISSYLDGLLYQRYLTYWDYIHLDTLLSLQVPKTHFPDEEIFIMYLNRMEFPRPVNSSATSAITHSQTGRKPLLLKKKINQKKGKSPFDKFSESTLIGV